MLPPKAAVHRFENRQQPYFFRASTFNILSLLTKTAASSAAPLSSYSAVLGPDYSRCFLWQCKCMCNDVAGSSNPRIFHTDRRRHVFCPLLSKLGYLDPRAAGTTRGPTRLNVLKYQVTGKRGVHPAALQIPVAALGFVFDKHLNLYAITCENKNCQQISVILFFFLLLHKRAE